MTPPGQSTRLSKALAGLYRFHPKKIDLSLGRIERLLNALGSPQDNLPPVFHVAGTNGKGSVVAYLRSILEAEGLSLHIYTSPHLVDFRERIRVSGSLIGENDLADILEECEKANRGKDITFFEMTTAAALLAFSRSAADACLLEVGLGGRLDATNVIENPVSTVISPVGLDHAAFLSDDLEAVAFEKAGIIKTGAPVVIGPQDPKAEKVILARAREMEAPFYLAGRDWQTEDLEKGFRFKGFGIQTGCPEPGLPGRHQVDNAALAIAALFCQDKIQVTEKSTFRGLRSVFWPARFQKLEEGTFSPPLPRGSTVWVDGGHNPLAGKVLAETLAASRNEDQPLFLVVGMMEGKNPNGFLAPLKNRVDAVFTIPIPGKENCLPAKDLAETARSLGMRSYELQEIGGVFGKISGLSEGVSPQVLITGSLYLAGDILKRAGFVPK